jgi:hypothetical protein
VQGCAGVLLEFDANEMYYKLLMKSTHSY